MRSGPHQVTMLVSPGMPVFEAALPSEIFGIDRSDLVSPWYRFSVASTDCRASVALSSGFHVSTVAHTAALKRADTVVVPACASVHKQPPPDLVDAVREAYECGARILSICSGAFILAAAGILDGRRATTHWMHAGELQTKHPEVRVDASVLYIEDRNVITSAGTAAGLDACLHVVRTDHGAHIASEVARRLVTPPHREGGQSQYVRNPSPILDNDWLAPLLEWLAANLEQALATKQIADKAGVSVRTLERRFRSALGMPPLQWILQQRVRRAQELLELTDRPVDWVADQCGFGTSAGFRAHFSRLVGVSPTQYRRTFHFSSEREAISLMRA